MAWAINSGALAPIGRSSKLKKCAIDDPSPRAVFKAQGSREEEKVERMLPSSGFREWFKRKKGGGF
jgi:hypothetical protein